MRAAGKLTLRAWVELIVEQAKQLGSRLRAGTKRLSETLQDAEQAQQEASKQLSARSTSPRTEIDPKRTGHIFRDDDGHIPDTPANRKKLEDVANKDEAKLGTDKFGNEWHVETQPDGTQVWTQSRNGKIINGGVNQTPKTYNPETGLSSPTNTSRKNNEANGS